MNSLPKEKLFNKAPGWIWSIAGAISLISFSMSVSFRMMDFNPGPILESYLQGKVVVAPPDGRMEAVLLRLEYLEDVAHEPKS